MALLGLGGVAVGGAAAIGAFAGQTEHVVSMWVGGQVDRSGSVAVTELIEYDFGAAFDKHGIYRDVPGLDPGSPISVSSPDAPADLAVFEAPPDSPSYPATRLRIGDPDETVSGRREYEIEYSLDGLAPAGALAWDAIGAQWTVPISNTAIEVVAPYELVDVRCTMGATGSTAPCEIEQPEPGRLVASPGSLDVGQGITIYAQPGASLEVAPVLDVPATERTDDDGTGVVLPGVVGLAGVLVAAGPASRAVRRRGRERVSTGGAADVAYASGSAAAGERLVDSDELIALATVEFEPPSELTPAQGGIVLTESVQPEHKVAWLIGQAIDGAIDLDEESPKEVRLRRAGFGDPASAPLLDAMFDGRDELDLGAYDKRFAAGWSQLGSSLDRWKDNSDLWDAAGDRRKVKVRVLGVLAAIAGIVIAGFGGVLAGRHGPLWLVLVAAGGLLAGGGLAAAIRAWELKVRTPEGAGLFLRVESFRRFLAQSEAYHAEQAAARGVLREYTAWAVAVGELGRWSRAVSMATNIPDRSALAYVYLAPALTSATSSASTAPSSSGGGGGGGVGGGGGGGGGGSW